MATPSTRQVLQALRDADADLVRRQPWLGRDDAVAGALWLGALGLWAAAGLAWGAGWIPPALAVLLVAFALSTLHELEHDLIHALYFPRPALRNLVFATIWVGKASLDPWSRGRIHRWHHAVSGQPEDIEERLIGLGLPWGPLRILVCLLPAASVALVPGIRRDVRRRRREGGAGPDLRAPPAFALVRLVNLAFLLLPLVALAGLAGGAQWAVPLLVLWVLPNTLRHLAIVVMSSSSHYTGIERGRLVLQNQVLDHPVFWPLQLLCWNFGATHVVHHFLVQQPFWRRTLVLGAVRDVLLAHGVRRNDLGTFARANQR